MAIHLLTCIFPLFCAASEPCTADQAQTPMQVSVRFQDDVVIAELRTNPDPSLPPSPAIVSIPEIGPPVWTFFSAGAFHGAWMLTVRPDTGVALLSVHPASSFAKPFIGAGQGTCDISKEAA